MAIRHLTRGIFFLVFLAFFFCSGCAESADSGSPLRTLIQEVLRSPEAEGNPLPKVIDRINFPEEYPEFAFDPEDDLLEIWFPSVRDQDAAIFLYQGQVWMLDCGDERAQTDTVPLLKHLGISHIDKLINTHPHHDHLNGLYSIDAAVPVRELLICFPDDSTVHMVAAMEYCRGNGIRISSFEDETCLKMGDGFVSFLSWMKVDEAENMNDRSAQFMVRYGNCSFLTMADIELRGQKQLLEALDPELLKADILRYPHHGKQHMILELYQAISPALVIITNTPRILECKDSTRFLDYRHASVAYTCRGNTILHLTTNGQQWLCEEYDFDPAPYLPSGSDSENPETETGSGSPSSGFPASLPDT